MTTVPLPVYRRCAAQRGSALIMVIFLITMLAMIVYAMFNIVKHDADLANAQKQAFRARQVAEMGLNWAMNPAIKPYDREFLEQTLEDGAHFSTKIRSEGGKINVNALLQRAADPTNGIVYRTFATQLFRLWGIDDNQLADDILNNLIDWTDTDSASHHNGMEKEDYQRDPRYGETTPYPFNRPFYELKEMTLVPGFDLIVKLVPDWRDYFTIYTNSATVDMNSAEAKVLATVAVAIRNDDLDDYNEMMEEDGEAHQLLKIRWGADGEEDTLDDKPLQSAAEGLAALGFNPSTQGAQGGQVALNDADGMASQIFGLVGANDQTSRIECVATVGDYRKRVVLVVRGRTGQPQILSREEIPIFE
jgi:type II secretory pathway component PulK